MKPSAPRIFFVERFLITDSIFFTVIGLFKVSISSWFRLATLHISKKAFLGCPICWHIKIHSSLLWSFVFLWCQLLCLCFHLWLYLRILPFTLRLAKGVSILFIFFKKTAFHFIDFFSIVFLVSILLISALISISFHLLTLGLVCSSSSSLSFKVRLFVIFLFLNVSIYSYKLPS